MHFPDGNRNTLCVSTEQAPIGIRFRQCEAIAPVPSSLLLRAEKHNRTMNPCTPPTTH